MTRPDPTPGKGDTPRVSDDSLADMIRCAGPHSDKQRLALDLRDARQSLATANARIKEIEQERDEAREVVAARGYGSAKRIAAAIRARLA